MTDYWHNNIYTLCIPYETFWMEEAAISSRSYLYYSNKSYFSKILVIPSALVLSHKEINKSIINKTTTCHKSCEELEFSKIDNRQKVLRQARWNDKKNPPLLTRSSLFNKVEMSPFSDVVFAMTMLINVTQRRTESEFLNVKGAQEGFQEIVASIPGLLKSLQIRALSSSFQFTDLVNDRRL
jgi:hypothetical protein